MLVFESRVLLALCIVALLGSCSSGEQTEVDPPGQEPLGDVLDSKSPRFNPSGSLNDTVEPAQLLDVGPEETEDAKLASDVSSQTVYECELGASESCVTQCGSVGKRNCGKYWGPCEPPDEICNNKDDNCDGNIDEGLTNACGVCGEVPIEVCDGLDNDCDGSVDEGLTNACGGCGVVPSEVCDGLDNDCDGSVDEGVTNACGQCGAVPIEVCDQLDNDCDGLVDEGIPGGCGCLGPTLQGKVDVKIPELKPDCPFGKGDNLDEDAAKVAARVEQKVSFKLPTDITLCSIEIVGGSSNFYFDDQFILTLNNVVLIASFNWSELKQSGTQLFQYSWKDIAGIGPVSDGPSCMAGATQCEMPGTQSYGQVKLAFDKATNEKLVQTGNGGKHQFKVIATGDNDPPKDCHHNGLSLQVKYNYVK